MRFLQEQILVTERLILRPFEEKDIEPTYQMNLDAIVSKYTGDGGVVSYDEIERRIRENIFTDYKKYGYGRMAIELKSTGEFIGFCGLKYLEDIMEVDLGYRLKSTHWNKGYATESCHAIVDFGFNELKLNKIIALVLPENLTSINVLGKLDFEYEKEIETDGLSTLMFNRYSK